VLSLTLKDSTNRWANIILGIFFTGLELIGITDVLANPSAYVILLWPPLVVPPALIVWYAWKSKQKALALLKSQKAIIGIDRKAGR
jgi:hypothetical protein